MKITNLNLNFQRNAGHCQFQTDFNSLVIKYTPQALGIVEAYENYLPLLRNEEEALVAITKSAITKEIEIADKNRNITLCGMVDQTRSNLNHFKPEIRAAAKRAILIMDSFWILALKPYDEESGLISKLVTDLREKIPTDLVTLSIFDWVAELEVRNNTFIELTSSRNMEEAGHTALRMKQVRLEVDAAYRSIVERINALAIVNGKEKYAEFARELNARISHAQAAICQSKFHEVKVTVTESI
jgi:hypothetical protein